MSNEAIQLAGSTEDLCQAWKKLAAETPHMRIRDAAQALGVSEAELVTCQCEGSAVIELRPEWSAILKALPTLGDVMCLTRNETVVHECHGQYEEVSDEGHMGLVVGSEIDQRLFLRRWAFGYALTQPLQSGIRQSLQFFDRAGTAVLKIYLTEGSNQAAFEQLIEQFQNPAPLTSPEVVPVSELPQEQYTDNPDTARFRKDWESMQDTHDFFIILQKHRLERQKALEIIGEDLAMRMPIVSASLLLEQASETEIPIMVFVGNRGGIQIHSGPVSRVEARGAWMNVLDKRFNLHMRTDRIAHVWLVRKPTADGIVTSLEVFDVDGELAVQFFGIRKPGQQEREDWRNLLSSLLPNEAAA